MNPTSPKFTHLTLSPPIDAWTLTEKEGYSLLHKDGHPFAARIADGGRLSYLACTTTAEDQPLTGYVAHSRVQYECLRDFLVVVVKGLDNRLKEQENNL